MEYRPLGRTGVMVSPICLGTMNFGGPTDENDALTIIARSLDAGINFIDTANAYTGGESERITGKGIRGSGRRDQIVLDDALPVLEMRLADEDRATFDALVPPGNAVADFHDSNNWYEGRIVPR